MILKTALLFMFGIAFLAEHHLSISKSRNLDLKRKTRMFMIVITIAAPAVFMFQTLLHQYNWASLWLMFIYPLGVIVYHSVHGKALQKNGSEDHLNKLKGLGVVMGIVLWCLPYSVTVDQDGIGIDGMQGKYVAFADLKSVSLLSDPITVRRKVMGYQSGDTYKGQFKVKDVGKCELFVKKMDKVLIKLVSRQGEVVFVGLSDFPATEDLYANIQQTVRAKKKEQNEIKTLFLP